MDISDMLNPESRVDSSTQLGSILSKDYSTPAGRTPRQLGGASAVSHGYKPAFLVKQAHASPATVTTVPSYSTSPSTIFHQTGRDFVSPAQNSLRRFDCGPAPQYDQKRANSFDRPPAAIIQPPMAVMERSYTNGFTQELYTAPNVQGTDQLAALATVATSRYSQDVGRDRSDPITNSRKYDDSARCIRTTRGMFRQEPYPRRESQPISPRAAAPELEYYSSMPKPSASRTVSVGSQTSRPNTPDHSRREPKASRAQLPAISTTMGQASPTVLSPSSITSPDSPRASAESPTTDNEDEEHKCSYTDSCETGSPLRKVVSHFFGRNKLATRKIPKHLWVYFCRKHYQRSRYRNPRGFATLQIQLVETQIGNLRQWGGVVDWTVKVRRREEIRSKNGNVSMHANDGNGDDDESGMGQRRGSGIGGSIPSHYLKYVGDKKTMDEVIALVGAIRHDMEVNNSTFPDLELLPNVAPDVQSNDNDNGSTDKGKARQLKAVKAKPTITRKRKATNDDTLVSPRTPTSGLSTAFGYNTGVGISTRSRDSASQLSSRRTSQQFQGRDTTTVAGTKHKLDSRGRIEDDDQTYSNKRARHSDSARRGSVATSLSQTITPPLSSPRSRRTSSTEFSPAVSGLPLERVDAALHTVRSQDSFVREPVRKHTENFTAINVNAEVYGGQKDSQQQYVQRDMLDTIVVAGHQS
ncbi:hypothetical protein DFH27DRAFT_614485 [Peziza echinospora]|nr:hypothetical protein DFH27DRAFT_614485 [Peziza echinospora]